MTTENDFLFDHSQPDPIMTAMPDLLEGLIDFEDLTAPFDDETAVRMRIETATMELPIELNIVAEPDGGGVQFRLAPPMYRIETTFLPVFHQLKLVIG